MKNKQQPGRTYTQCLAQQQQQQQKQTTNHKLFGKTYKPPNYTETLQSAAQVTQALTSGRDYTRFRDATMLQFECFWQLKRW